MTTNLGKDAVAELLRQENDRVMARRVAAQRPPLDESIDADVAELIRVGRIGAAGRFIIDRQASADARGAHLDNRKALAVHVRYTFLFW